jgi:hypothetical protein
MKMAVFWVVSPLSLAEVNDVSEVLVASIITALIARRHNPEDSHIYD